MSSVPIIKSVIMKGFLCEFHALYTAYPETGITRKASRSCRIPPTLLRASAVSITGLSVHSIRQRVDTVIPVLSTL